jgi:hypothetical protein
VRAGARECAEEAVVFVEGLAGAGGVEGFWHSCMFWIFFAGRGGHLHVFLFRSFPQSSFSPSPRSLLLLFLRSFPTTLPSSHSDAPSLIRLSPFVPSLVLSTALPSFFPPLLSLFSPSFFPRSIPSHLSSPPSSAPLPYPFFPQTISLPPSPQHAHKLTTVPGSRASFGIASAFLTQLLLTASTDAEGAEMSNLVARWRWAMRMGEGGDGNGGGLMGMGLGVGFGGLDVGGEGSGVYEE